MEGIREGLEAGLEWLVRLRAIETCVKGWDKIHYKFIPVLAQVLLRLIYF